MRNSLILISKFLIILLFIYAATSKLINVNEFQQQMYQSPVIPEKLIPIIAYLLPIAEIVIACLLIFDKTSKWGLLFSFFIMLFFFLYMTGLVAFYVKVPCACGGVLGHMSYTTHIIFNLFFTVMSLCAYWQYPTSLATEK